MTPDRWQVISRIYHDALALPPPARDGFVRSACAGDEQIAREVRSLLEQPSRDSFLNLPLSGGNSGTDSPMPSGRLGRFDLKGLLGAGGMGQVFRAHDSSLGRDVAIKILPAAFLTNPDRLARFEREARVLAALSHPHIAAIYGFEEIAGDPGSTATTQRALVLELVEGDTLAERLQHAPVPVTQALEIAGQIADALEAAHEKGIVHRDLKPANVKIRPDGVVKVLDFGLAKADGLPAAAGTTADLSPGRTSVGVVLGTPAYMSPEQARGAVVDKRTDLWAFGCLLYEMLAGRAPFAGTTPADIIAAVIHQQPDWRALPDDTPHAVRRLLHRCLEKNPKRRLRDMGDARLELDDREDAPAVPPPSGVRLKLALGGGMAIVAAVVLGAWLVRATEPREPLQFTLASGDGRVIQGAPLPSPDGRQLVFIATTSGDSALWVRSLGSSAVRRLAGTDNAQNPFWSADGESIGFSADRVLRRIPFAGGPVQRITDLDPTALGATWNHDNVIVFTPSNKAPLYRVPASGGQGEPLTTLDAERRENSHRWPQFLPDGRHFLFTARSDLPDQTGIHVGSIDNPGVTKRLLSASSRAIYTSSGHLLYLKDQTLLVHPFDVRALALTGEPVAIAGEVVVEAAAARGEFAASADGGVVTYVTIAPPRLVWFDRAGAEAGTVAARGAFAQIRLAPNQSQAAVVMPAPENGNRDVWVIALASGALTRVTSHPASDWFPVWSPDGGELIFASDREATPTFYRASAAGGGNEQLVFRAASREGVFPTDWSRDGRALVFHSYPRGDVSLLPLAPPAVPIPQVQSPFTDWTAALSPDGRWMAYVSDESGSDEVYVKPILGAARYRVSTVGGVQPRWRGDGRELFFIGANGKLFSVAIGAQNTFTAEAPKPLFDGCSNPGGAVPFMYRYDVTADGNRSLWICDGRDSALATVVVNGLP